MHTAGKNERFNSEIDASSRIENVNQGPKRFRFDRTFHVFKKGSRKFVPRLGQRN